MCNKSFCKDCGGIEIDIQKICNCDNTTEDKRNSFIKLFGDIGETYNEEDWHCRFGIWCMAWDSGFNHPLKIK